MDHLEFLLIRGEIIGLGLTFGRMRYSPGYWLAINLGPFEFFWRWLP